jgi:hypothetical protein
MTERRTYDANKFVDAHARIQRASTRSSIRTTLHSNLSSSSSASSSGKSDKVVTSADQVPQRTPLAVMASTRPSSSSATVGRDTARKDDPSALSSTKSRTRATEIYRASSSVFTSHRVASSTPLRQAVWRPHPDGWPGQPDRVAVLGACHRSSRQAAQAMSTTPLASRIRQPARPQPQLEGFVR